MAESDKNSRRELDLALNPIGSLAFRERLESNRDELIAAFNLLSSSLVTLTLSLSGYRIVECFFNADIDDVNVRLAESLSAEWEGLEKVLRDVNGRFVCETLLNRGLKAFAQRLITITPKNWWFSQTGLSSLPILIKAIDISEVEVASEFCSHEQMEENLCDSPEGLYSVLKLKRKSMNQPGWKEALKKLILLKARSIAGSEALVHVIVYGDYFVLEIVEMICCRRESYNDSITVSLIIRLIESGSTDLKQRIFHFLCTPHDNPLICRIRSSTRFDDFKRTCDSHFTPAQRGRLDEFLSGNREGSKVGECLNIVSSHDTPTEAMDTVVAQELSNKRRIEPITEIDSVVKKPRKEVKEAVPIVDSDRTSNVVTVSMKDGPSVTSNNVTPDTGSTARASGFDQGVDGISMTINQKSGDLLSQLVSGSFDIRSAIFECIQNGLLALMMDERTFEIVKWFIVNGDSTQKDTVELRVMENVDRLVKSGACGRLIVRTAIDECVDNERKKELNEKFEKAMKYPRSFPSFVHGTNSSNEIVIDNMKKKPDQKATASKKRRQRAPGSKYAISAEELRNGFNEIVRKLKDDPANVTEFEYFANRVAASCKTKNDARRGVLKVLIESNLFILIESKNGMIFLKTLVSQAYLRAMLTPLIASILHLLSGDEGGDLLEFMLSEERANSFMESCLVGKENSYFLKMFRADINECVSIGMTLLKKANGTNKCGFRGYIERFRPSLAYSEKGRTFIRMADLDRELERREAAEESNREVQMVTEASTVTSHEDTVATPVETTPSQMVLPLSTPVPSPLNSMGRFSFRKNR